MVLDNLGNLHRDERPTQALQAYEEALTIYRAQALKSPDVYLPNVAMTLLNLGLLHSEKHRQAQALQTYEEALMIYRVFAQRSPGQYQPKVQLVERNLAELKP
jgi:tetratricopeptide (TPR) repeat protein